MANTKISNLTAATTPVAGTEVLPIVQSSATVKLAISDLTPGLSTITAVKGGTGQTSYAVGDLLYANTTTTLAKLADVATGNALISGGVSTAPSWGKVGLTTHVSGTLPVANGGTNLTSFTANGVVYASSSSALATGSALVFDGTNVGIAQTDPTTNGISGYSNLVIGNSASTTAGITIRTTTTGTPLPGIVFARGAGAANGKVYYNQDNERLYCESGASGGVYLALNGTSWTSVSDERVKDIIEPIENATQKLSAWRTVIGKYKSDLNGVRRSFLIAQDVLTTFPEAVDTDTAEQYGLNYQDLIPVLVKAVQELKAENDLFKARLDAANL